MKMTVQVEVFFCDFELGRLKGTIEALSGSHCLGHEEKVFLFDAVVDPDEQTNFVFFVKTQEEREIAELSLSEDMESWLENFRSVFLAVVEHLRGKPERSFRVEPFVRELPPKGDNRPRRTVADMLPEKDGGDHFPWREAMGPMVGD